MGTFTGLGLPILTVPGPNGSSYSMTLSYTAGTNPNADVGWVGYGWSLNPGAIVRNQKGLPDDWFGEVTYYGKRPTVYTISSEFNATGEITSGDLFDDDFLDNLGLGGSLGYSSTDRFDSETGFGDLWGLHSGVSILGNSVGLSYMNDNGDGATSAVYSLSLYGAIQGIASLGNEATETPLVQKRSTEGQMLSKLSSATTMSVPLFGGQDFSMSPPAMLPFRGYSENFGKKVGISAVFGAMIGVDIGVSKNFTEINTVEKYRAQSAGYMYSDSAAQDNYTFMDYHYENDVPFILDDKFLPIPFNGADLFSVTGGGNFRLYNRGLNYFRQNSSVSEMATKNLNISVDIGAVLGVGARGGLGSVEYRSTYWKEPDPLAEHRWISDGDEPWFFRYLGDKAGTLEYSPDIAPIVPNINKKTGFFGAFPEHSPSIDEEHRLQLNDWERPARNGYIGYTLQGDMTKQKGGKYYRSYTKDNSVREFVSDRSALAQSIGEFALYGQGGARYIYGLPVYVRNTEQVTLSVENVTLDSGALVNRNRVYKSVDKNSSSIVLGQKLNDPIAQSFLLTAITTPDYVDLTGNGPTDDDLGGWVKFHYHRYQGSDSKSDPGFAILGWQYWRQPYNGLSYNQGDLSDPRDDVGSYSHGLRELYYLEKIETKSHIAIFYLNDAFGDSRLDAYPPKKAVELIANSDSTLSGGEYTSTGWEVNSARYLSRIDLYTRDAQGDPDSILSRTYFEYDYSLRPNMISSLPLHPDSTTRNGMLTLKKVWTEPVSARESRIRPYTFGYFYRQSSDYSDSINARYPEIAGFADDLDSADQNPQYSRFDIDPWGYYRPSMESQRADRSDLVLQNDTTTWDPAAWQLKWVRMPTGGEMQVQYEEDEYEYVQDKPVLVMARLQPYSAVYPHRDEIDYSRVYIDLPSIGIDPHDLAEVKRAAESIQTLLSREKKAYFKYFYAYSSQISDWVDPEWGSGYIDGYLDVSDLTVVNTVTTDAEGAVHGIRIEFYGENSDGNVHHLGSPKRVCKDFVKKRKRGEFGPNDGVPYLESVSDMATYLAWRHYKYDDAKFCLDVDFSRSYIRLPLMQSKRGGGLRVKRILYSDGGINGDSTLYGTEYRYERYDPARDLVVSSGVAANEPPALRNENPLIHYMVRNEEEKLVGKAISGRDFIRNQAPLGESMLPAPHVGYSRVASFPIHQGESSSGFSVKDFYTLYDYPTDRILANGEKTVDFSTISGRDFSTSPLFSNLLIYRQQDHEVYRSQGYRFLTTDIHGKPRLIQTLGGRYDPIPDNWIASSSIEYDYFLPEDSIPLLYATGDSIRYGWPGKVVEVVQASRKNGSYISDHKGEIDAGWWFISGMGYYFRQEAELSTLVTTKSVQLPTHLRGVRTYADGDYEYRENVAFDPLTGGVAMTRTWDGFDGMTLDQSPSGHEGSYVSYSFPARDIFATFQSAATNEKALIRSGSDITVTKGSDGSGNPILEFSPGSEFRWLNKLSSGDFIELTTSYGNDAGRYHVDRVEGRIVFLEESVNFNGSSDPSFDSTGVVDVEVIRSGRRNSAGATLGGAAVYSATDDQINDATNFGWAGGGATARLNLLSQLNAGLNIGSDTLTLTSSTVDTSLAFLRVTDGVCGSLDELNTSLTLWTIGDTVFVGTNSYVDTIVTLGAGGVFELSQSGQIRYRAHNTVGQVTGITRNDPGPIMQPQNLRICGDSTIWRTLDNVIAASAIQVSDTIEWTEEGGTGTQWQSGEPNAFERGERGRYSTRTAYVYRTDRTQGSQPTAGERIYKNAGVWDDFSLFNWSYPSESNLSRWRNADSVVMLSGDNHPIETVDALGIHYTTRLREYRTGINVLEQTGANAEHGTILFESFEVNDVAATICDTVGHAGTRALQINPVAVSDYDIEVTANDHLADKGLLIRFWMRGGQVSELILQNSLSTGEMLSDSIVRVGQWTLVEQLLPADSIQAHYSSGEAIQLVLSNSGDSIIWVDDIKVQPLDAVSTASIFDTTTLAIVATFDNDNFGSYPVYDGKGKAVRVLIETARGRKIVADAHSNVSGVDRVWNGQGSPWGSRTLGVQVPGSSILSDGNRGTRIEGTDIGILNAHVGLENQSIEIFGVPPGKLVDALKSVGREIDDLTSRERGLLEDYRALYDREQRLREDLVSADGDEERTKIQNSINQIQKRQAAIRAALDVD